MSSCKWLWSVPKGAADLSISKYSADVDLSENAVLCSVGFVSKSNENTIYRALKKNGLIGKISKEKGALWLPSTVAENKKSDIDPIGYVRYASYNPKNGEYEIAVDIIGISAKQICHDIKHNIIEIFVTQEPVGKSGYMIPTGFKIGYGSNGLVGESTMFKESTFWDMDISLIDLVHFNGGIYSDCKIITDGKDFGDILLKSPNKDNSYIEIKMAEDGWEYYADTSLPEDCEYVVGMKVISAFKIAANIKYISDYISDFNRSLYSDQLLKDFPKFAKLDFDYK